MAAPSLAPVFVALALPHILYAYIWFFPESFRKIFRRNPVERFAFIAATLKVIQFSSVIAWVVASGPSLPAPWSDPLAWLTGINLLQWTAFLGLGAAGQALNVGIYKAIGTVGVYYGFKLGHKVPWHSGFPFNVCPHPQYVGSALTVWACWALLCRHVDPALLAVSVYWTGLYVVTGVMEDNF